MGGKARARRGGRDHEGGALRPPARRLRGPSPLGLAWAGHLRGAPNGSDASPKPRGKRWIATVRDRWCRERLEPFEGVRPKPGPAQTPPTPTSLAGAGNSSAVFVIVLTEQMARAVERGDFQAARIAHDAIGQLLVQRPLSSSPVGSEEKAHREAGRRGGETRPKSSHLPASPPPCASLLLSAPLRSSPAPSRPGTNLGDANLGALTATGERAGSAGSGPLSRA